MTEMDSTQSVYTLWKSPISAEEVAKETHHFGDLSVDQLADYQSREVFWVDICPAEDGRSILFSYDMNTKTRKRWTHDLFSVRSLVHEYGGGAILVIRGVVYFSNMNDQRLYRQTAFDVTPEPLTAPGKFHYADGCYSAVHDRLYYIREEHADEVITSLVQVHPGSGAVKEVVSGMDFYSSPRVSADGRYLAWVQWSHPNMPWDNTALMVVELDDAGLPKGDARPVVHGTEAEPLSVLYPTWTKDGRLLYAGDHEEFWDIWTVDVDGQNRRKVFSRGNRDVVDPPWVFNRSCFCYLPDIDSVAVNVVGEGVCLVKASDGSRSLLTKEASRVALMRGCSARLFASVSDFRSFPFLLAIDASASPCAAEVIARSIDSPLNPADVSVPRQIEFDTTDGAKAFAYYYPPRNSAVRGPSTPPPLIVEAHGGPTASAVTRLRLSVQYWTSRGFALVDVDYRGSTGYGRRYREALKGRWGVCDVDDCCAAVQYLVRENLADRQRICIHGGSAGGFTTLACLAFRELFSVGASYYGVADLELLMEGTHKFESHYLETLIGRWPAAKQLFVQRSPIHSLDKFSCPVVFFQGAEDKVVPPNQAELMFAQIREKGIMSAMMLFPGEQHGFRKRENKIKSLTAELYFYAKVLDLTYAGEGDKELEDGGLEIHNLNVRTRRLTS